MNSKLFGALAKCRCSLKTPHLLVALLPFAALITSAPANAFSTTCLSDCLSFTFSFTQPQGLVSGLVTGLNNNESGEQGAITINTYPSSLGLGTSPLSATSPTAPTPGFDDFIVSDGKITSAVYQVGEIHFAFLIDTNSDPEEFYLAPIPNDGPGPYATDQITFTPVTSATPLPATLALFAGGLGVVGYLTRRRKRHLVVAD
jgi:hypothetical protein